MQILKKLFPLKFFKQQEKPLLMETLRPLHKQEKVINLRTRLNDPALFARLTWQYLFDLYRLEGDLKHMDSILCDYGILIRYFNETTKYFLDLEKKQLKYKEKL